MRDTRALATPPEVASFLQKPEGTLRQWRYMRVGPKWIKLEGGNIRYRWADVEKWLDEQAQAAA